MLRLPYRTIVAAALLAFSSQAARAQATNTQRGPHDSITVTTLTFPGLVHVSSDDLRRLIFTRPSPCRLPFLVPVCMVTGSQLFTDRRRTTSAAMADDITKIRVYLWRRGYRDATVDTVLTPGKRGTAVAFTIVEGEATRISTLTVRQHKPVLNERELGDIVELRDGGPVDFIALDSTLSHLRVAIWNKGYGDVVIDTTLPRPDASHRVPFTIDIDPRWLTRVGHVEFEGNEYLSDETLRHGVLLQPGSLYTRDAVLESQKRLFQSPAIARAIVVTPAAGDSVKSITIAVAEAAEHQATITLGFNTIDFVQAAVEAKHNGLGGGRWIAFRGAVGNLLAEQLNGNFPFQQALTDVDREDRAGFLRPTYQGSIELRQSWLGSARTSAGITAFAGRRSLPNVAIDEDFGGTVGIVHDLAPRTPIGFNYHIESTRVEAAPVYFCGAFGVCDAAARFALTHRQRLAPLGVSGWVDRSDDLEAPSHGYTAILDAEHASSATGSTFAYNRASFDGSYYRALNHPGRQLTGEEGIPIVLALHSHAGWVHPFQSDRAALGLNDIGPGILHPRTLFYAGGMQSVRGFAENELGPTVLQARRASLINAGCTDASISSGLCDPSIVPSTEFFPLPIGGSTVIEGSVELRVPLFKSLGGVVFVDGGYVGTQGLASIGHARGAVTPGAGFRYRSPLGQLRLDIGLRPVGNQVLPVVVAQPDGSVITLATEKIYSPVEPSPGFFHRIARSLVVSFAMGQAF